MGKSKKDLVLENKFFATSFIYGVINQNILDKYNARNKNRQFDIVCKAKSLAEANRKMEQLIGVKNVFKRDFTYDYTWAYQYDIVKKCDENEIIIKLSDDYNAEYYNLYKILEQIR